MYPFKKGYILKQTYREQWDNQNINYAKALKQFTGLHIHMTITDYIIKNYVITDYRINK